MSILGPYYFLLLGKCLEPYYFYGMNNIKIRSGSKKNPRVGSRTSSPPPRKILCVRLAGCYLAYSVLEGVPLQLQLQQPVVLLLAQSNLTVSQRFTGYHFRGVHAHRVRRQALRLYPSY